MAHMQLALVVIFAASAFGCALGYSTWFDGWCFEVAYVRYSDLDASRAKCADEGARLPVIRSAQEQDAFVREMRANLGGFMESVYLGLNCTSIGTLQWEDGTPANYTNFNNANTCQPGQHFIIDVDGYWKVSYKNMKYVACMSKRPSDSPCDDFEMMAGAKQCYKVFTEVHQRDVAEETCVKYNSHLISVHDKTRHDYVLVSIADQRFREANSTGQWIHEWHTGLSYKNGNYSWSDESDYDFNNFAPAYPNEKDGNCVAMQTTFLSGQWMNYPCTGIESHLPFICARMIVDEPVQPDDCPAKTEYSEGSEIYSPSYLLPGGVIACSYFVMVNETKKASLTVREFESDACCDTLTIYDGAFGNNIITRLSGSISPGTVVTAAGSQMRLEWNSTSGNNVKGFHMHVQAERFS